MDKCKDFLPDYLRFMKGLVDSPDLPLNISRELLQQSREVQKIGKALEKNILKQLSKILKSDRDKYEKFWAEFGKSLKIGVYNSLYDPKVKDDLQDLLMFLSTKDNKLTTLAEYVERMPESQKKIYCAIGNNIETISQMPQMELLKERGIEVLCLTDPVDEFAVESLRKYADKDIQSINREDFELDDEESKKAKSEVEELAKSHEELLKVNPNHELFKKLSGLHALGKDTAEFKDFCNLLYVQALLIEGIMPKNPVEVANKIAALMSK